MSVVIIILVIGGIAAIWSISQQGPAQPSMEDVMRSAEGKLVTREISEIALSLAEAHAHALFVKSKQLIAVDAYGSSNPDRFITEVRYFISEIVMRNEKVGQILRDNPWSARAILESASDTHPRSLQTFLLLQIMEFVDEYCEAVDVDQVDLDIIDPIGFEALCQQKVSNAGWASNLTKGSGDQGADVLCKKDGVGLVLQCKLYSSPIGNKAVQEAFAAKTFYGLDHAAVVSNQPYTKSAIELANTTGVVLLHYADLDRIDQFLGRPSVDVAHG